MTAACSLYGNVGLLFLFCRQSRVTDHRIGLTVHGLDLFLQGGDKLDDMVVALQSRHEAEALQELTNQCNVKEAR